MITIRTSHVIYKYECSIMYVDYMNSCIAEEMKFCDDKVNFVGNLNKAVTRGKWGPLMGPFKRRILNSTYKILQYRNLDVQLKPNDTINYYLNVSLGKGSYTTITRSFTVLENGTIQHGYVDNVTISNPEVFWVRAKLIPDSKFLI